MLRSGEVISYVLEENYLIILNKNKEQKSRKLLVPHIKDESDFTHLAMIIAETTGIPCQEIRKISNVNEKGWTGLFERLPRKTKVIG